MNESLMRFYLGRDKVKAVVVAATDRENAQTMVDASTRLYPFFALTGKFTLAHQCKMKLDSYSQDDAEHVLKTMESRRWAQNQQ